MKKISILIIDDAFFIRNLIKRAIMNKPSNSDYSFEILAESSNGKEGLELFKMANPDIVTVDINLPNLNGVDFVKKVREFNPDANIIVISSCTDIDKHKKIADMNAIFVAKPIQENIFWDTLDMFAKAKLQDKAPSKKEPETKSTTTPNKETQPKVEDKSEPAKITALNTPKKKIDDTEPINNEATKSLVNKEEIKTSKKESNISDVELSAKKKVTSTKPVEDTHEVTVKPIEFKDTKSKNVESNIKISDKDNHSTDNTPKRNENVKSLVGDKNNNTKKSHKKNHKKNKNLDDDLLLKGVTSIKINHISTSQSDNNKKTSDGNRQPSVLSVAKDLKASHNQDNKPETIKIKETVNPKSTTKTQESVKFHKSANPQEPAKKNNNAVKSDIEIQHASVKSDAVNKDNISDVSEKHEDTVIKNKTEVTVNNTTTDNKNYEHKKENKIEKTVESNPVKNVSITYTDKLKDSETVNNQAKNNYDNSYFEIDDDLSKNKDTTKNNQSNDTNSGNIDNHKVTAQENDDEFIIIDDGEYITSDNSVDKDTEKIKTDCNNQLTPLDLIKKENVKQETSNKSTDNNSGKSKIISSLISSATFQFDTELQKEKIQEQKKNEIKKQIQSTILDVLNISTDSAKNMLQQKEKASKLEETLKKVSKDKPLNLTENVAVNPEIQKQQDDELAEIEALIKDDNFDLNMDENIEENKDTSNKDTDIGDKTIKMELNTEDDIYNKTNKTKIAPLKNPDLVEMVTKTVGENCEVETVQPEPKPKEEKKVGLFTKLLNLFKHKK